MNTDLRFTTALKQSEREGDLQGVLRARKQMVVKHMEEELNDLALALLQAARAREEADRLANEEFERQLLGIAEGDAFAIKSPVDLSPDGEDVEEKKGDDGALGDKHEEAVAKVASGDDTDGVTESKDGGGSQSGSKPSTRPGIWHTLPGPGHEAPSLLRSSTLSEEEQIAYRIENSAAVQTSIEEAARLADALGS